MIAVVVEPERDRDRTGLPSRSTQTCEPVRRSAASVAMPAGIAQRLVRHAQDVVALRGDDLSRRGHAGLQQQIGLSTLTTTS